MKDFFIKDGSCVGEVDVIDVCVTHTSNDLCDEPGWSYSCDPSLFCEFEGGVYESSCGDVDPHGSRNWWYCHPVENEEKNIMDDFYATASGFCVVTEEVYEGEVLMQKENSQPYLDLWCFKTEKERDSFVNESADNKAVTVEDIRSDPHLLAQL